MALNALIIVITVVLRIFSNSFLNVFQKKFSKEVSSLYVNFYTYFILAVFSAPLFFILYFKGVNPDAILFGFIGGIFGALGNCFLISALKRGEISILGPVNSYKAIVGLVFGFVLLKETPVINEFFGMLLIIFGSYFIFENEKEGFSFKIFLRQDVCFRILALVFTGIEAVFIKKVIILSDTLCSFFIWVIFGCFFSFLALAFFGKFFGPEKVSIFKNKAPRRILEFSLLSFLVLIMQMSTNFVFSKISVPAALSLFQLSNVLNVILGYKMFREDNLLKKMIGSIIMILGSSVIIFN